jgi:S1-C subfamily serine protease
MHRLKCKVQGLRPKVEGLSNAWQPFHTAYDDSFNPDYAIGIVTRVESAMKTDIPASIFFENVVTPTVKRKYEEIAVFAAISARSRLSIA